ncbi:MAG: hypothetical protein K2W78_05045 [Xanthobacteraceae bacterium]|nr:hypothetical protein [Xanthobacteraceae bacterium]
MDDSEQMSRAEMIKARADIKRQITKLSYSPIIGGGGGATSPRPALIARLKKTLVEIDEKLAKTDAADNA